MYVLMAALVAATGQGGGAIAPPPPAGLLVDLIEVQSPPYLAITASPRPRFTFNTGGVQHGAPSVAMQAYQITVREDGHNSPPVWSSGRVIARAAVNVLCNTTLVAGARYSYEAQYWTPAGGAHAHTHTHTHTDMRTHAHSRTHIFLSHTKTQHTRTQTCRHCVWGDEGVVRCWPVKSALGP